MIPTDEKDPSRIPISRPHDSTGLTRTADDVLLDAGVTMVPGFTYKMETGLAEDVTYKYAVVGSWTHAKQESLDKASS